VSVGPGSDDDDFPSATGKLLSTTSGGSKKKSSSSSGKSKTSSDKHKKKSSTRDKTDEDKKKKSHKKDEDKKQKPKKTDEDADDLLASFGEALIAPAPKSKAFDPLGGKKFDPLGAGGGASKKFDPLGSASALSGLLAPSRMPQSRLLLRAGLPRQTPEPKSPTKTKTSTTRQKHSMFSMPPSLFSLQVLSLLLSSLATQLQTLTPEELLGVRQFIETQNSGYNQPRKPGKSTLGPKKEGIADLSILSEESANSSGSRCSLSLHALLVPTSTNILWHPARPRARFAARHGHI
jgi:hypothetical protein